MALSLPRYFAIILIYLMIRISPFPKLLTQSSCSVVKFTDRKIRWIIKEKSRDVLSTADISRLQSVSESRVRQLLSKYRKTGYMF
jgi:hypothetical protein